MTPALSRNAPAVAAGTATAALLFAAGISGGSYDIVDRQTIAVLLWWAVGVTALVSPRLPSRPRGAGLAVIAFAAGIALWIAANATRSISEERTVIELGRAITHLAPLLLIGWLMPARWWRAVVIGATVGAVGICAAALGNRVSPGFLGQSDAIVFTEMVSRLAAPLGYWNAVGSWAVITAALLLALSAHAGRPALKGLAAFPIPLAVAVGYLTYSRSSIGAALLAITAVIALSKHRWTATAHVALATMAGVVTVLVIRGAPQIADATGTAHAGRVVTAVLLAGAALAACTAALHRTGIDRVAMPLRAARLALGVSFVVGAVVVTGLAVERGPDAWDRFSQVDMQATADPTQRLTTLSNGFRVAQWRVALDEWKAHKLDGTGAGTFELSYNVHGEDSQFVRDAHSAYFEALSEQGLVGFLLLVGLTVSLIAATVHAAARTRTPLERGLVAGAGAGITAFLFGSGFDWFWEVTALALLVLILSGAVIAATRPDVPSTVPRGRRLAARIAVALLALIAVLAELPGLVGTSEVRRSQQDARRGDYSAARAHADQAINTLPWASSPFLQRGLVDEQDGQLASAREALTLAIARDPLDWRLPLVLARIEARAGNADAALAAYREAKRLRPHGQFFANQ